MGSTIRKTSRLPASADVVWAALKRPGTFAHVVWPVLTAPAARRMETLAAPGLGGSGWLFLFGVVPLHRHTIEVVSVDDAARRLETAEHGGVLRSWRHVLTVRPDGQGCVYTDEVTLDAGALTPVATAFARGMYAYRHLRWRRLARQLASN